MIEANFITIDGNKIAYYKCGHGTPMILLHGIMTWSFIWEALIPDLSYHFTVYAIDLLGCGQSDKPLHKDYSLKAHALRLENFCNALNLNHFHLVGHDLGGGIAQIYGVRNAERLKTLSLINSVAYEYWPVQPIVAIRTPIIKYLVMAMMDIGALKLIVKRGLFQKKIADGPIIKKFKEPFNTLQGQKAFLHFAKCLDNSQLLEISDQLRQFPIPTLIIRGTHDVYLEKTISEKLQSEIPKSEFVQIENAGHFIQLDVPGELSEHLIRFTRQENL